MPTWDRSSVEGSIQSIGYRPEYALELVKLWRGAFQRTMAMVMAIEEHNRFDELSGHLDCFATIDPASLHVLMDIRTREIGRGFAASEDNPWATSPDQLADIR
jgi:hypothetical protein